MAAYACTVTPDIPVIRKSLGFFGIAMLWGKANITNYNSTTAEVTAITGKFKNGSPRVLCLGVSNGAVKQLVRWDDTAKAFKCYVPTTGLETANDVNVGEVGFFAIGML